MTDFEALNEIISTNYGECQCHEETMRIAASAIRDRINMYYAEHIRCKDCKYYKNNTHYCTWWEDIFGENECCSRSDKP